MRISDWSSDVCSSDLGDRELAIDDAGRSAEEGHRQEHGRQHHADTDQRAADLVHRFSRRFLWRQMFFLDQAFDIFDDHDRVIDEQADRQDHAEQRSEEHTSELQSLMRISYAVFCLKKKKKTKN